MFTRGFALFGAVMTAGMPQAIASHLPADLVDAIAPAPAPAPPTGDDA